MVSSSSYMELLLKRGIYTAAKTREKIEIGKIRQIKGVNLNLINNPPIVLGTPAKRIPW